MGGFASSRIVRSAWRGMVKRTFEPGFRFELRQKDLNLALEGARTLAVPCPHRGRPAIVQFLCRTWRQSLGSFGIVRALEMMATTRLQRAHGSVGTAAELEAQSGQISDKWNWTSRSANG